MNSTFRARWLASLEVIISSIRLRADEETKSRVKNFISFHFSVYVRYVLKQLFTSVSVKVVHIYLIASRRSKYLARFTSTLANNLYINWSKYQKLKYKYPKIEI